MPRDHFTTINRCIACGYDLSGSKNVTNICPECGASTSAASLLMSINSCIYRAMQWHACVSLLLLILLWTEILFPAEAVEHIEQMLFGHLLIPPLLTVIISISLFQLLRIGRSNVTSSVLWRSIGMILLPAAIIQTMSIGWVVSRLVYIASAG